MGRSEVLKMLEAEGLDGFTVYPRDAAWHTAFITKIKRKLSE